MKKVIKKIFRKFGLEISRYYDKPGIADENKTSRKTRNLTYYNTTTGNYYLPTDAYNDNVANTIKGNKVFEKEVVDLAATLIKPNKSVIDIGANFGQMSILFSNLVGENGKVFGLSPSGRFEK